MPPRRDRGINLHGIKESKRVRIGEDNNSRPDWSELPRDLLELITKHLGVVDFLLFACVCRSWRSCAAALKLEFMANQPPLLFFMSTYAKRSCYFYDIFDGRLYKRTLPNLVGKACIGFSCGYLIMDDKANERGTNPHPNSQIYLINPFTGHELQFPCPRQPYSSIILASCVMPYPQFMLIALSEGCCLQFRRYGDDDWTIIHCRSGDDVRIEDVVVFKGKAFVVTKNAEIWVVNLDSQPHMTMLKVGSIPLITRRLFYLRLVASVDQLLLVVDLCANDQFEVLRLDFRGMKWERVNDLGHYALFMGYRNCCGACSSFICDRKSCGTGSTAKMRDKVMDQIDGINYLDLLTEHPRLHSTNGEITRHFRNSPKKGKPRIAFGEEIWYFPHLSFNVDSVC